jgi:DNA-binding CsgD family transcriptional regulator
MERPLMRTHEQLPLGSDPAGTGALPGGARPIKASGLGGSARPAGFGPGALWLGLMLDEVDYGMLLLDEQAQVLHANHAARAECDAGHPLQLLGRELHARLPEHVALLHDALAGARLGRRRLLALGDARQPVSVAVIPLGRGGDSGATLLMMGRRQVCERLSVQGFARCQALTPAETRVLEGLCDGLHPREVAKQHGITLATVRSQICSMRGKTGAQSIRELVRQVSVLPPMLSRLRGIDV